MNYKLRDWKLSDSQNIVEHANNYNVAKWLTNQFPYPYTENDAKVYIEAVAKDNTSKVFAIEVDGEAVGSIGIFQQADIHEKNAEIGYWLSEKYWGKGIMTKAIREIVDYGFNTFDIVRIYARPFSTNKGSQRVLEKAGFALEARLKNALYKNGEYMDELIYSKLKRWKKK
ncbi:MAG: GNAT family protein [Paludibacteraceae bacterium]